MKYSTLGILMVFCLNTFAQKTTDSLEIWTMFTLGNLVNAKAYEFAARGLPKKLSTNQAMFFGRPQTKMLNSNLKLNI